MKGRKKERNKRYSVSVSNRVGISTKECPEEGLTRPSEDAKDAQTVMDCLFLFQEKF